MWLIEEYKQVESWVFEELEELEEIFRGFLKKFLKKFSEMEELEEEQDSRRRGFKEYNSYLRV